MFNTARVRGPAGSLALGLAAVGRTNCTVGTRIAQNIDQATQQKGACTVQLVPAHAMYRTLRAKLIDFTHGVFRHDKIDYDINVSHGNEEPGCMSPGSTTRPTTT